MIYREMAVKRNLARGWCDRFLGLLFRRNSFHFSIGVYGFNDLYGMALRERWEGERENCALWRGGFCFTLQTRPFVLTFPK